MSHIIWSNPSEAHDAIGFLRFDESAFKVVTNYYQLDNQGQNCPFYLYLAQIDSFQ